MLVEKPTSSNEDIDIDDAKDLKRRPILKVLLGLLAVGAIGAATTFGIQHMSKPAQEKSNVKKPVPVSVAVAVQKSVPVELNIIGTVQAYSTVQVKSQVVGQLLKVHFNQGDFVKEGDVLFTIDKRALEAQLSQLEAMKLKDEAQIKQAQANVLKDGGMVRQAEATVAKDKSQQKLANRQAERYLALSKEGVVSKEQSDQQTTTLESYTASVDQDEAALASARATLEADQATTKSLQAQVKADAASIRNLAVQLDYTTIRAPISGRTGSLNIYQGNLIKDNDTTPLISIDQINPIYVSFAVPEQYLAAISKYSKEAALRVSVFIEADQNPEQGQVTFVDNNIDSTTGTINLKAKFANNNHRLWPGQFVNVVLVLKEQPNALLVPAHAVQTGQSNQYVFVVKSDNTVDQRTVKVERVVKGFAVITHGLAPGEQVVTDGQMQLMQGSTVKPQKSLTEDDEQ
jgi:multidrug efflux system membrane fusion protein